MQSSRTHILQLKKCRTVDLESLGIQLSFLQVDTLPNFGVGHSLGALTQLLIGKSWSTPDSQFCILKISKSSGGLYGR